ncbi:MAG: hypothetical protein LBR25_06095 [Erysipelotrichaceae bacterium]|jgi:hypothetical protein|nr:hypothetical protein [Erysipelotrichaceae bacterium]
MGPYILICLEFEYGTVFFDKRNQRFLFVRENFPFSLRPIFAGMGLLLVLLFMVNLRTGFLKEGISVYNCLMLVAMAVASGLFAALWLLLKRCSSIKEFGVVFEDMDYLRAMKEEREDINRGDWWLYNFWPLLVVAVFLIEWFFYKAPFLYLLFIVLMIPMHLYSVFVGQFHGDAIYRTYIDKNEEESNPDNFV